MIALLGTYESKLVKEFPEITTQFPCKKQLWQLEDEGIELLFI